MKKYLKTIVIFLIVIFLSYFIICIVKRHINKTIQTSSNIDVSNTKIEWGIQRGKDHAQPNLGKKNRELIEKYDGLAMGNANSKNIYLTFDLGYEAGYTENILNTLKDNDVKAAFFITSHYANSAKNILKRMIEEGHIVREPYS